MAKNKKNNVEEDIKVSEEEVKVEETPVEESIKDGEKKDPLDIKAEGLPLVEDIKVDVTVEEPKVKKEEKQKFIKKVEKAPVKPIKRVVKKKLTLTKVNPTLLTKSSKAKRK